MPSMGMADRYKLGAGLDTLDSGLREQITKRFSSENEVVGEGGKLEAIVFTGAETLTAVTSLGGSLGDINASTFRTRVELSNEDLPKQTTETIDFSF